MSWCQENSMLWGLRRIGSSVHCRSCCLEYLILTEHSLSMVFQNSSLRYLRSVTPGADEETDREREVNFTVQLTKNKPGVYLETTRLCFHTLMLMYNVIFEIICSPFSCYQARFNLNLLSWLVANIAEWRVSSRGGEVVVQEYFST